MSRWHEVKSLALMSPAIVGVAAAAALSSCEAFASTLLSTATTTYQHAFRSRRRALRASLSRYPVPVREVLLPERVSVSKMDKITDNTT